MIKLETIGASTLQKGGKIKVDKKAIELLKWVEGDTLGQFFDSERKALVILRVKDIIRVEEEEAPEE